MFFALPFSKKKKLKKKVAITERMIEERQGLKHIYMEIMFAFEFICILYKQQQKKQSTTTNPQYIKH